MTHGSHAQGLMADKLCASQGGQPVLHGVSLHAPAGQWLAVVGPNGAGKSTLLRCLAGLLPISAGAVSLAPSASSPTPPPPAVGAATLAAPGTLARARLIAWLGQDPVGDDSLSVADTVALGRLPHQGWLGWGALSAADRAAIDQALRDTDMAWAFLRPLGALSGGERQRVSLARALAVQAPIMLLDEPVAHLDAPHQRLVAQVLRREAGRGRCIISVLHELPLALAADQVLVMQAGRVLAQGASGDATVHRAINTVFDGAVAISCVDGRWVAWPQL